ncbi:MAG: hypothetical protein AAB595_00340 [Patescibacteria group bacterium]
MTKKTIIFLVCAILFIVFCVFLGIKNKKSVDTTENITEKFVLYDKEGNVIDYKKRMREGYMSSTKEAVFSNLEENIKNIQDGLTPLMYGKVLVHGSYDEKAVAVFDFKKEGGIVMDDYIESPIFSEYGLVIIDSYLIDIDNNGELDIFVIADSADRRRMGTASILLNNKEKYKLATPLTPSNINRDKVLSGDLYAENATLLTTYPASHSFKLYDLDNDKILELVTLDLLSPPQSEGYEIEGKVTKRVYELINGVYTLKSENLIDTKSQEYLEINKWPVVPN